RDHPPGDRAPDLQAVDHLNVVALGLGRAGDDGQQPRLLREGARAGAARLAVEADHAALKARFQGSGNLDARDAVAARLELGSVGAAGLDALAPVVAHAHRPAIFLEHFPGAVAQLAQLRGVGAAEARLDAPPPPPGPGGISWRPRWRWGGCRPGVFGSRGS